MTLPVPIPRTWSVNDIASAALLNTNMRDAVNYLLSPPLFVGSGSVAQSMPNGVATAIALDTTVIDTYSGHSNVTNNTRYVAPLAGYYLCLGHVQYSSNTTGFRLVGFGINGTGIIIRSQTVLPPVASGNSTAVYGGARLFLNAGDYVEMLGNQNSGGALNTVAGSCAMELRWEHS